MPAPLVVSIPHSLGREEAVRRLKTGLARAASSVPVLHVDEERWEDNRMMFRVRALGQAAAGHVDVADDHVKVEVVLPWLLLGVAAYPFLFGVGWAYVHLAERTERDFTDLVEKH